MNRFYIVLILCFSSIVYGINQSYTEKKIDRISNNSETQIGVYPNGSLSFTFESDGTLSSSNATYETLVTSDDDIPNKKYIDDKFQVSLDQAITGYDSGLDAIISYDHYFNINQIGINMIPANTSAIEIYYPSTTSDIAIFNSSSGQTATDGLRFGLVSSEFKFINQESGGFTFSDASTDYVTIDPDGTIRSQVATYETLVIDDDDIPNKKYVDDSFQAIDSDLTAISALTGTGVLARTGAGTYSERTITGTTNEIDVTNGDGVSGNPTVGISDNAILPGTEGVVLPTGTTAQRAVSPTAGEIRYNSDSSQFEGYTTEWGAIGGDGGSGGLDIFYSEDYDGAIDSSSFSSGLNATFDTTGVSLGGTLSDETSAPIAGSTSIKYVTNATATNSNNDWISSPVITLDEKQQNNHIGINFFYTWDGSDDLLCVVVWDDTNNVVLNDSTDCLETASTPTRYSLGVYIPDGVTSLKYGFHHTGASESTKTLIFDDVELSSNPFVYKNIASRDVISYTQYTSKNGSNQFLFANEDVNTDTGIVTASNTDHTRFTFSQVADFTAVFGWTGSNTNGSFSLEWYDVSDTRKKLNTGITDNGGGAQEVTLIGRAEVGDYLIAKSSIAGGASNDAVNFSVIAHVDSEHVLTPTKSTLTNWQDYTPSLVGFGTVTGLTAKWRQVGDSVEIQAFWTNGTVTAVEAQIPLPNGYTVASDNQQNVGVWFRGNSADQRGGPILATTGDSFLNFSQRNIFGNATARNPRTIALGTETAPTGEIMMLQATVQVSELNSDATFLAAIPMNYYQKKDLAADVSATDTDISSLKFNNLVLGKMYRTCINIVRQITSNATSDTTAIVHNSVTLAQNVANHSGSGTSSAYDGWLCATFEAVATSVSFSYTRTASNLLGDGGTTPETFSEITELNYTKETTRFE